MRNNGSNLNKETDNGDHPVSQNTPVRDFSVDPSKYQELLHEKQERIKELTAINRTVRLLRIRRSPDETLQQICSILQAAYQYPDYTVVRIIYDEKEYTSMNFHETPWCQSQDFETVDNKKGEIEVYYIREFPELDEGPFLREERDLIASIAGIIATYLNTVKSLEQSHETQERLKELACINRTTSILKEGKPIEEALLQISQIIPQAWQYPEFAAARIQFDGMVFKSPNFKETKWTQREHFLTVDNREGAIEVYYLKEFPPSDEGPFMKEERELIHNLASLISGYLNSVKGKALLMKTLEDKSVREKFSENGDKPKYSRQLLQTFLNKSNYNRDIYHDLMPFKVNEILLIASLYDAYNIEREGKFSEYVLGDYQQLNLTSFPRITGISTSKEAMQQLRIKHFDLVIIMVGVDKNLPVTLSASIKEEFPYIPVYLLLNNNSDLARFEVKDKKLPNIDKIFIWNGESKMFLAMIKHVEDQINVDNDTRIGMVRIILLVEDSAKYYSRYLPLLYGIVMEQTRRIIDDVTTDELYKVLKLRARPKILLASNYEEAVYIFNKYRNYLLCLITDIKFNKGGTPDDNAGISLVEHIRKEIPALPVMIQSSEASHAEEAYKLKAAFIDKNSDTLSQDLNSFITHYLGFGNFVYRDNEGRKIAVARSLKEFENLLGTIPDESLTYHAQRDHFSMWLMARSEIQAARILLPYKVTDFKNPQNLREYLISIIQKFRNEQNKGKLIPFEESAILDESNVVSLTAGSLGGKGRGLAFINSLIYNYDFSEYLPNINIRAPKTSIMGTEEFEYFLSRNKLFDFAVNTTDYDEIKRTFLKGKLTESLIKKLKVILRLIHKPLAVRSSGLFEDSLMQPFAGIFETYILPNNHPDLNTRLQQLMDAIRLVFASIYSPLSKSYIESVNYKIEEEKMAVVLQEVVGNQFDKVYYPHISGVAQSYNYYPFSYMKPEEGFGVIAMGLGKYVVEGEKAYRFSPKYPAVEINSPKDQYLNSQLQFYAVDLNKKNIDLLEGDTAGLVRLDIDEAERHGTLKHCASVFDLENNRIIPGITHAGPRIVNFADILRYNYIPLAQTLELVMDVVKEALGSPVEIEFAVDMNRDADMKASFYLLQIKPLIGNSEDFNIEMNNIDHDKTLLYTTKGMGNGVITHIEDVIYVDKRNFDKSKTVEMASEIDHLNAIMGREKKNYILIGPGRWGTRDRWIGIPVNWAHISNARIIVETSLEGYSLDASSGSHFFHNLTSMNVGYFSVLEEDSDTFINYDILKNQELVDKTTFFRHVRFNKPLTVKMDGKKRMAVITFSA